MRTELDFVNRCLGTMGEVPLNELDDEHPYVAAARAALRDAQDEVQGRGWWFNTEYITFSPNDAGTIALPMDTLSIRAQGSQSDLTYRDGRLYNTEGGGFVWDSPVSVILIRRIPFADLPSNARMAVGLTGVLQFQSDYDGDQRKAERLGSQLSVAAARLSAEHIRATKANMLWRNSTLQSMNFINGKRWPSTGRPSFKAGTH